VLEKFCAVPMVDVHLPTTDGRTVILTRHTQPEKEVQNTLGSTQADVACATPAQDHRRRSRRLARVVEISGAAAPETPANPHHPTANPPSRDNPGVCQDASSETEALKIVLLT
jgi:hypothetical protein